MNIFDNNQTMPRCVSQYWCFLWAPFSKLYGTCALFALRKVPETEVLYQSHIESPQKMTKNENKWKILHLGPQKMFIVQNLPKTQCHQIWHLCPFCSIWHLCPFRAKKSKRNWSAVSKPYWKPSENDQKWKEIENIAFGTSKDIHLSKSTKNSISPNLALVPFSL